MATGIVYPTQEELAEKVKEKIFPNRRKGIKGEAHQQAVLDMVASLWREQGPNVETVTGPTVDNTNPVNPIVNLPTIAQIQAIRPLKTVGGVTIEGSGDIPIPAQGVQSVTGDGVGGTSEDVVLSFPNADEVDDSNTSNKFATASQLLAIASNTQEIALNDDKITTLANSKIDTVTGDGVDNTDPLNPVLSYETAAAIKAKYESNANTNAYTDAEKNKLASLESSKFVGQFPSLVSLQTASPTAPVGSYAYVDQGLGQSNVKYIWDDDDTSWIEQGGASTEETPATIKAKYESNPDTNAYTDAEKANLANQSNTNTGDETASTIQSKRPIKTVDGVSLEGSGNIPVGVKTVTGQGVDNSDPANPVILPTPFSIVQFFNSEAISTLFIQREVFGSNIIIKGRITIQSLTVPNSPGNIRNQINNIIPKDFLGFSWFKMKSVTFVHNEQVNGGSHNGYLELDEMSSYSGGSLNPDKTALFIPGQLKGITRSYNVDSFNPATGGATGAVADRVEVFDSDNYIFSSPKDLRLSGFNMSYLTSTQAAIDFPTIPTNFNANGIDISFIIEGFLI